MGNSIFKRMFGKKEVRVLFMGLDCAGKTTTLYKLKLGEVVTTMPTIGFNVETIDYKNVSMTAWDMGGRDKMRTLHRHYFAGTSAIVYIVDSTDRERLDEAIEELLRSLLEDELRGVPVAILANKQDLPNAMTSGDVEKRLLSMDDRLFRNRSVCVFSVCATSGDGLYDALDWLTDQMSRSMVRQYVTGETGKQSGKPVSDKDATPNNNANKDVAKLSYLSSMVASIKKMLM